ncbi:MAG: glucose-6-phosphate dehydrogenase [Candidatus Promineifilaceae bacterium]|nr:glucose-6-phosphate dehydrogenase [Candidatus Promineifilaceae bacterium]
MSTTTIVIFGASGDLTHRKLVPALYHLFCKQRLPENTAIVGVSRSEYSDDEFRGEMRDSTRQHAPDSITDAEWSRFAPLLHYQPGDLTEAEDFERLKQRLSDLEGDGNGAANRLYYLAIAPRFYDTAVRQLGEAGMTQQDNGWRRVVIEKPFGHDLPSARALNEAVHESLEESQIYRIDHYLGKETVQNILVFRFANSLYEPVWNRNYIDHVQITAAETVDVGHRAGYYDGVGVVRDMVQNHMLQLLSMVAIEPPASFDADALRDEKVKVLKAIRPIESHEARQRTVRGQYAGYRSTEGVDPQSDTATFTALKLSIDNWRWQGVPFYLRSGKALARKLTEISILFRRPPHVMFPLPEGSRISANDLSICIQPDEGIHFSFQAKVPGTPAEMRTVDMEFHYQDAFGQLSIPDAYERLLLDALKGDASLFTRGDAIELAWAMVDQIIEGWRGEQAPPLEIYEPGSWGPEASNRLISHDGYGWSLGCDPH